MKNWLRCLWKLNCHDLLSASWRSKRAGVVQSKSKGLRTRGAFGGSIGGQEKTDVPAQLVSRKGKFSLPLSFCFIQVLSGLEDTNPHWGVQSDLLSLLFKC